MPTLAEEEASEESDYEEESEDVFNELVDRLRKVALEAQVCQVHHPGLVYPNLRCPPIFKFLTNFIRDLRLQKKN